MKQKIRNLNISNNFKLKEMQHTQKIQNQHADEQIEVSGSEIESGSDNNNEFDDNDNDIKQPMKKSNVNNYDAQKNNVNIEGGYNAEEYAHLQVSKQVKELFKSIQKYTPILTDIDTKLRAFIPDYIPAVGEVDAFLKMPRPDSQPEVLGLNILDEPCLNQSDKAKIELLMMNNRKQYIGGKYSKVHSIEQAQKNPKQILSWITSVGDVHKNKQPPTVSYSKHMPDIDSLMQVWPQQVEEMFSQLSFPSEQIDLSLAEYSKIACNLIDIPVHEGGNNSVVESLHVLFTLYSAFKENQHFNVDNESNMYQA